MSQIKGITNLSLVDFDGEVCATLFLGGCNFRCKFCGNSSLVLQPYKLENMPIEPIIENLNKFKNYLTAVCITGGEPLIHGLKLIPLMKRIKDLGLKVKLDTNGMFPYILDYYIEKKLIDYIAMDIKAPLTQMKYNKICGKRLSIEKLSLIALSIDRIMHSNVNYEFRTTVVPGFHIEKDIEQICKYSIKGAKRYALQNFWNCGTLVSNKCPEKGFSPTELENFATIAKKYVQEVKIRNLNQNL